MSAWKCLWAIKAKSLFEGNLNNLQNPSKLFCAEASGFSRVFKNSKSCEQCADESKKYFELDLLGKSEILGFTNISQQMLVLLICQFQI